MVLSKHKSVDRPENRAIATQLPKTSCCQRSEAGSGVMSSRTSISLWS